MNDLETLVGINNRLASTESQQIVEAAQIHNPPKEVQNALTGFITSRLEKIENDGQFEDLIKLHIRQRLPEASFDQLIRLQDMMSKNNTHATDVMNKLFRNETSGKTVIEQLRDNDVSSTAAKLYDSTDSKDVLQAVTYLGSIISKIQESNNIIESPLEEEEE